MLTLTALIGATGGTSTITLAEAAAAGAGSASAHQEHADATRKSLVVREAAAGCE
jgi:hypothetical protein